jgi:hypothetical protein
VFSGLLTAAATAATATAATATAAAEERSNHCRSEEQDTEKVVVREDRHEIIKRLPSPVIIIAVKIRDFENTPAFQTTVPYGYRLDPSLY